MNNVPISSPPEFASLVLQDASENMFLLASFTTPGPISKTPVYGSNSEEILIFLLSTRRLKCAALKSAAAALSASFNEPCEYSPRAVAYTFSLSLVAVILTPFPPIFRCTSSLASRASSSNPSVPPWIIDTFIVICLPSAVPLVLLRKCLRVPSSHQYAYMYRFFGSCYLIGFSNT